MPAGLRGLHHTPPPCVRCPPRPSPPLPSPCPFPCCLHACRHPRRVCAERRHAQRRDAGPRAGRQLGPSPPGALCQPVHRLRHGLWHPTLCLWRLLPPGRTLGWGRRRVCLASPFGAAHSGPRRRARRRREGFVAASVCAGLLPQAWETRTGTCAPPPTPPRRLPGLHRLARHRHPFLLLDCHLLPALPLPALHLLPARLPLSLPHPLPALAHQSRLPLNLPDLRLAQSRLPPSRLAQSRLPLSLPDPRLAPARQRRIPLSRPDPRLAPARQGHLLLAPRPGPALPALPRRTPAAGSCCGGSRRRHRQRRCRLCLAPGVACTPRTP